MWREKKRVCELKRFIWLVVRAKATWRIWLSLEFTSFEVQYHQSCIVSVCVCVTLAIAIATSLSSKLIRMEFLEF